MDYLIDLMIVLLVKTGWNTTVVALLALMLHTSVAVLLVVSGVTATVSLCGDIYTFMRRDWPPTSGDIAFTTICIFLFALLAALLGGSEGGILALGLIGYIACGAIICNLLERGY